MLAEKVKKTLVCGDGLKKVREEREGAPGFGDLAVQLLPVWCSSLGRNFCLSFYLASIEYRATGLLKCWGLDPPLSIYLSMSVSLSVYRSVYSFDHRIALSVFDFCLRF